MRLLTFQAKRFWWRTFSKTLPDAPDQDVDDAADDCVVAFVHAETCDDGDQRSRVFRHVLKHLKWIANKRHMRTVVLHSFAHLGGESASPEFAQSLLEEIAVRLESTGYTVHKTPFGYFCAWGIDVHGESLAKVYKEIRP